MGYEEKLEGYLRASKDEDDPGTLSRRRYYQKWLSAGSEGQPGVSRSRLLDAELSQAMSPRDESRRGARFEDARDTGVGARQRVGGDDLSQAPGKPGLREGANNGTGLELLREAAKKQAKER
jgi:hypothetical protein